VRLWNAHTLAEEKQWNAHEGGTLDIQFHAKGHLATVGRDQHVRLWNENAARLADFGPAKDHVLRVAFAGEANQLLVGDWSGEIKLWSSETKTVKDIVRPTKPSQTVALVLPPSPSSLVVNVPPPKKNVPSKSFSDVELVKAKRQLSIKAAESALSQLKLAQSLDPDNVALSKAVTAAEVALRSLTSGSGQ
jgi:WD40 repeat protein